jgi:hypothetical protein
MAAKYRSIELAVLVVGLIAVTPADALAYVDPGTGSYLFQLAAAGLLAGAFTVRRYWEAVKAMFGGQPAGQPPSEQSSPRE